MKEIINTYKQNRETIENFIHATIQKLQISQLDKSSANIVFNTISCAKMIYFVDENYKLASPYYYKSSEDDSKLGASKAFYFDKILFSTKSYFLSNPYISGITGQTNVTYAAKVDYGYIVIDFDVVAILEKLGLIQSHKLSRNLNRFVYGFMGFSLLFFSVFLGIYAIYIFGVSIVNLEHFDLESTFKAIIALTLGLAIYDLAKTILEQEIFFKSIADHNKDENKVFIKFLISIIIALSIEALMVVFKIALVDYTDMINALYLILGVSLMIFAVGKYNSYMTKR
jgi:hypothetical protein